MWTFEFETLIRAFQMKVMKSLDEYELIIAYISYMETGYIYIFQNMQLVYSVIAEWLAYFTLIVLSFYMHM